MNEPDPWISLGEAADRVIADAIAHGMGFMRDGEHVPIERVRIPRRAFFEAMAEQNERDIALHRAKAPSRAVRDRVVERVLFDPFAGEDRRFYCPNPCAHCVHSGCDAQAAFDRKYPAPPAYVVELDGKGGVRAYDLTARTPVEPLVAVMDLDDGDAPARQAAAVDQAASSAFERVIDGLRWARDRWGR